MKLLSALILSIGLSFGALANAAEHHHLIQFNEPTPDICLKYVSTNKIYKVQATLLTGSELNQSSNSFDYDAFKKYVAVFWSQDEVTLIKLEGLIMDDFPMFETLGTDQSGRAWKVKKYNGMCF